MYSIDKIISLEELEKWSTHGGVLSALTRKIVATNGCFDVIHAGHVGLLKEAKSFGSHLIVGLNSDDSVRSLKGPERPVNNQRDRAFVLSEFKSIFRICIFNDTTAHKFLEACRPHFYLKGGDYALGDLNIKEKSVLDKYNTQIKFFPLVEGLSTTKTLEKVNYINKK